MNLAEAFAVLDVSPDAAESEIDAAYKAAVRAWHPDRFASVPHMRAIAEAKLKRLNEAYALLGAPRRTADPPPASAYIDDLVLYQGFDPRLRPVGQHEPAGRPAETHLLDRGLVLITRRAGVFTRITEYPYETILRVSHGDTRWQSPDVNGPEISSQTPEGRLCVLEVAVPDGPQRRAIVSLSFRNDQFAVQFATELVRVLQHVRRTPAPTPPPAPRNEFRQRSRGESPQSRRPTPPAGYALHDSRLSQSLWLLGFLGLFLAGLAAIALVPLPTFIQEAAAPSVIAPEPGLVLWTEPAAPAPHQPYEVCIRLQLPPGVLPPDDIYSPLEDLLLVASAADGTSAFETFKYQPPVAAPGGQAEIRVPAPILDASPDAGESLEVYSRLIGRWTRITVREPRESTGRAP